VHQFFTDTQTEIQGFLEGYLSDQAEELSRINSWGRDACERLAGFCLGGKTIRGGLTVLAGQMFGFADTEEAIKAGAAVELLQAAFLIHDDIMDRDAMRRGEPSLFQQYQNLGQKKEFGDALHFGESMGICVGDISFFLVVQILSQLNVSPAICRRLTELSAREIISTCTAQMQDVYWGYSDKAKDEQEILDLYIHKTGRYTFSLPLSVGAVLAEQPEETLSMLQKIGEHMGIVFQIKDDELSLYGDEADTGKPVGSDVKEGKTTLFKHTLFRRASAQEREQLDTLFGSRTLTTSGLQYIRELLDSYGIREELEKVARRHAEQARSLVGSLAGAGEAFRGILLELPVYLLTRTS